MRASGQLDGAEPSPFHDSPFYDVYACADGGFITLGALEPQFYALLLTKLGIDDVNPAAQYDKTTWPALKARFAALFASQPRAHWSALLEGSDVCFAPVLSLAEAATPSAQRRARPLRLRRSGQPAGERGAAIHAAGRDAIRHRIDVKRNGRLGRCRRSSFVSARLRADE